MISDYHLHCNFSSDSEAYAEDMIRQAVKLGMRSMCFTDHYDIDYPGEEDFIFDIDRYFQELGRLKEIYADQIQIQIGLELGLQKHLALECRRITERYPFDFIIGSSHVADHMDPYYPVFFEGKTEEEGYRQYFQSILDNLASFQDFDVYGHLDYVVRYGPHKNQDYSYEKYKDILDEILRHCVQDGIGLEMNTGGLAYGLGHPNPHPDILKRYRELGGEILTIGSDAHHPKHLGFGFAQAEDLLKECGFSYYTIFQNRRPAFVKI